MVRKWLAVALASALMGCYVEPFPDDSFDTDSPEDPTLPRGAGWPDFQLESLVGPATLTTGSQELVRARLCNRGDTSASTGVSFFLSTDTVLDLRDAWLASSPRLTVLAGSCREASARVVMPAVSKGRYFLIALADPDELVLEGWENNNLRVEGTIWVDPTPARYDTTPPEAPVIAEASWQYGTTQHGLRVRGSTEPGAEVGIFIDVACTGMPAATVFAGSTGAFTADLTVAASSAGSIRRVYVAARDAALNESSCVEGPPYETPCPQGYANCDGDPANGCEVNLTEDAEHCGTCGASCPSQGNAMGVCVAGTCGNACPVGTYDCDGSPDNGCESTQACSSTVCVINRQAELAITALSVVEDPVRTAPGGAWHFGTLMRAMAGDQDPSTLVRQWLRTWTTAQAVNGLTVPARTQMMTKVLGPWEQRSGGANQPLDFRHAPFRLLAIMNRMDLRQPGVQAGEGRFVFGVLDAAGSPLQFTVILEYALPGGTPEAIQRWARDWHELGQLGLSHPMYNAKLQALTDRFAKSGVMPGRPFGNALNQIRTNEVDLGEPWEMREFNLTDTGLRPATVKLTPDLGFDNSSTLADYVRANETDILAEQHRVPESFAGLRFLGAASRVPEDFFWRAPGAASEVRHKFSLNTCSGCHTGETGTEFTHVAPRAAGRAAVLSPFLRGGTVRDPVTQELRSFDDLTRRANDMAVMVCGVSTPQRLSVETFEGFPAASNLPRARVH